MAKFLLLLLAAAIQPNLAQWSSLWRGVQPWQRKVKLCTVFLELSGGGLKLKLQLLWRLIQYSNSADNTLTPNALGTSLTNKEKINKIVCLKVKRIHIGMYTYHIHFSGTTSMYVPFWIIITCNCWNPGHCFSLGCKTAVSINLLVTWCSFPWSRSSGLCPW